MKTTRMALYIGLALLMVSGLLAAACGDSNVEEPSAAPAPQTASSDSARTEVQSSPQQPQSSEAKPEDATRIEYIGQVEASPHRGIVGSEVNISGQGFPADSSFDLVWHTVEGRWDIRGDYREEYHGRIFDDTEYTIANARSDAEGNFSVTFTVPEDYGFNHNITVEKDGQTLNRVGFDIQPTAYIEPAEGPLGTPITVTMTGIGWQRMENSWTLMYDNKYTGWLSAVTTKGTAEAVIPATGGTGKHVLRILHGAFQYPYLNTEQNPRPDQPVIDLEFTITDGEPILPPPVEEQGFAVDRGTHVTKSSGPDIWTNAASGPIGTPSVVHGTGFEAGQEVDLFWYRVVGNRISGSGWDETATKLGTATAGEDGTWTLPFNALDDLGGPHRIEGIIDGEKVAETEFTITASALPVEPASGQPGTLTTVHLKGVGWTETANIYHLVYDNSYLGYACGFNSQGDVTVYLPLAGEPGWHFIDLYPGIYKGKDISGTRNFRIPQLTYEADHPGEKLPGFRFAVEVTE